jgi:CheY-like chemotaxis protein
VKALNYFSQIDPYYYDLIVMDVLMPWMNGIQLYSKIKIMNPNIKVLFLSALDGVEELLSIFPEVKRSQIMNKTINLDEFRLKIKETNNISTLLIIKFYNYHKLKFILLVKFHIHKYLIQLYLNLK